MSISSNRIRQLLAAMRTSHVLVVGDVMLDHFLWGQVARISPEAPVPVLDFERESFMPGGAANVARNLSALGASARLFGITGRDAAQRQLRRLLAESRVNGDGLLALRKRHTTIKTRIVAHQQQIVRVDRETRGDLNRKTAVRLLSSVETFLGTADAVILEDYGKGVVTQFVVQELVRLCRQRGVWLSADPKPVHHLDLSGLSLITPNHKEALELAGLQDSDRHADPLADPKLQQAVERIFARFNPALLLVTLGDQGMLLCESGRKPFHIPTVAQEVFDVSGAGDTVIASYTLAIAAGASPIEAALVSNHAAGVVVGKVGTATVSPEELLASFNRC